MQLEEEKANYFSNLLKVKMEVVLKIKMKAVLFLCLLAFMACDIVEILKCVYETPIVQEIISLAIKCIVSQDWTALVDKIKESIPELIQAVIGCVAK